MASPRASRTGRAMTSLAKRIEAQSIPEPMSGCFLWLGAKNRDGYAQMSVNGKTRSVARWLMIEKLAPGQEPDHLCRNRACVNPTHLEAVSHKENVHRGRSPLAINAAKIHCLNGHSLADRSNLYPRLGHRQCRLCALERAARRRHP